MNTDNHSSTFNYRGFVRIEFNEAGQFKWPDEFDISGQSKMIVTVELNSSKLLIYPEPVWVTKIEKFRLLPKESKNLRDAKRFILGSTHEMEFDEGNFAELTPHLMKRLGNPKKCFLVGEGERLTLWEFKEFVRFINISKSKMGIE